MADARICFCCEKITEDYLEFDGDCYCDECFAEYIVECTCCGNETHRDDCIETNDGLICEACSVNYYRCEDCNDMYHEDDLSSVNGNYHVCYSCIQHYFECYDCGDLIHEDESCYDYGSELLCQHCYGNYYFNCEDCGRTTHVEDRSSRDDYLCNNCDCGSSVVHEYHHGKYNTIPVFHTTPYDKNTKNFYGVELETEAEYGFEVYEEVIIDYSQGETLFHFEDDGSIHEGAELVSMPMSLLYHQKFGWFNVLKRLKNGGVRGDRSNIGMHIHVSKKGLNSNDLIKVGAFMHGIKHNPEIIKIARRKSNYGKFKLKETYKEYANNPRDRYEAVNFANSDTIEFRIFASTLDRDELIGCIEFCDSVKAFVKTLPVREFFRENIWNKYMRFTLENKKKYVCLVDYFTKQGVLCSLI